MSPSVRSTARPPAAADKHEAPVQHDPSPACDVQQNAAAAVAAAPQPGQDPEADCKLRQARNEIEALQRELNTHRQACTSMSACLDEMKVSLQAERHQREALEAWQRDVLRLHLSLLETRASLWETAESFSGDDFRRIAQTLSRALGPLLHLLAPELPVPAL